MEVRRRTSEPLGSVALIAIRLLRSRVVRSLTATVNTATVVEPLTKSASNLQSLSRAPPAPKVPEAIAALTVTLPEPVGSE